jgi:hypothetical protein
MWLRDVGWRTAGLRVQVLVVQREGQQQQQVVVMVV